MTTYSSHL